MPPSPPPLTLAGWAVALALAVPLAGASAAGQDTRALCLQWGRSHGAEQIALANAIGAQHLLTKDHKLAEAQPGDRRSLYRSSDLQRLCRSF